MSYSLSALLSTYMDTLATTLTLPVMLGFPDLGRAEPTFPLAALTFEEDDYHNAQGPLRRIGQVPRAGSTVALTLYLFADTEVALLELVDRLRVVRESIASVTAQELVFVVRYQATKRNSFGNENPKLNYVTETAVTLSHV